MFDKIKNFIVEQVVWAEHNMIGKSGKEKRNVVVQKLDDMIKLPALLEPFDGPIIGFFVDMVVSKLNSVFGHSFGVEAITQTQEQKIADSLEVPSAMIQGLKDAVLKDPT